MDNIPKPTGRYQIIFVLMAGIMVVSLGIGIIGPVIIDAFQSDDDGNGGNSAQIDISVENAFRATAEANPDDPNATAALANYLANTGNLTEAIPWYEKAIELNPHNAALRLDFARSLSTGNMDADAELQYHQSIALDPTDPQAHYYLAELYFAMNPQRTIDAIDQYEQTIQIDPRSFVSEKALQRLVELGVATPEASPSPNA